MMADTHGDPRRAGPLDALKTVLAGMIGIRRKAAHDNVQIRPLQLVVAALLLVAFFIFTLIAVVRIVTS